MKFLCVGFLCIGFLCMGSLASRSLGAEQPLSDVRFPLEVRAVLTKSGCNTGACHGNRQGRGGLRLSLRGEDPAADYDALVRALGGRRIDRLDPAQSLLLLKPTLQVVHQGGRRFAVDSVAYRTLLKWLREGARPPDSDTPSLVRLEVEPRQAVLKSRPWSVPLRVTAHLSDGTRFDATRMANYESSNLAVQVSPLGLVRSEQPGETTISIRYLDQQVPAELAFIESQADFTWSPPAPRNYIDRLIDRKLRRLQLHPSELASDQVFVRRAYLDTLGILPTGAEARAFVADSRADKRDRLIDALLARPEFAEHWALKWSDLLRNEEKVLDAKGVVLYYEWLREAMAADRPLDQFVRELVASRGSTYTEPAANFYRANRDPSLRGETTARLFLGVRLQCARCHNHPFDHWTQDDYYGWAAVFGGIDYKIVDNKRTDKLDKHEFIGEQIVQIKPKSQVKHPRTGQTVAPQFLGAPLTEWKQDEDRLQRVGAWLTAPDNRAFSRTLANLIWYHTLGQGLVEPIDDFRDTNPAAHPELLDALADDLVAHQFSLRHLVRVIMQSRVYQQSAQPHPGSRDDPRNFSRAIVRRLPAEQLLDAQCQVLDTTAEFVGYPTGIRAGQIPGVRKVRRRKQPPAEGDRFLFTFGKPERLMSCACERSNETTLGQAMFLVSGEGLHGRLADSQNRLARWNQGEQSAAEIIDQLYWTALCRGPSDEELDEAVRLLDEADDRLLALQDLAWALLNSKEFIFRH